MIHHFGVDAGMIGAIPLSAVEKRDGIELGLVVVVPAGATLRHEYFGGTMHFTLGIGGGADIPPGRDESWWVGDLCYVLANNFAHSTRVGRIQAGYDAACEQSFRTPRQSVAGSLLFPLADGRQGLVHSTAYGDGCYTGVLTQDDEGRLATLVIYTGDDGSDEEE